MIFDFSIVTRIIIVGFYNQHQMIFRYLYLIERID